jgi:hypothetical protein
VCTRTIVDDGTTTTTKTSTTTPTPRPTPVCNRIPAFSCPNLLDNVRCCPYEFLSAQNVTIEFKRGRNITRISKMQYCCDVYESDYVQ